MTGPDRRTLSKVAERLDKEKWTRRREDALQEKLNAVTAERDALVKAQEDMAELVEKAMRRAFNLGQTYWQQADSESYAQHRKSDVTASAFRTLSGETVSALASIK